MVQKVPTENERLRPIVLCADDYALTPSVSRGILSLLALGRLSATGAMTNRPHWPALAGDLKAFAGRADLGVHLNLTCGAPLGPMPTVAPAGSLPPPGRLLALALRSAAARAEIAAEASRQLDAFEQAMGRPPDFVDGHQHVHAAPGVAGVVLGILRQRYAGAASFYARDPADRVAALLQRRTSPATLTKAMIVTAMAAGFGARLRGAGLSTNRGFSGFSAFDPAADYGEEFAAALRAPGPAHLVMCHPGEIDDELRALDPVVETRPRELMFLASDRFVEACAAAGVRIAGMGEVAVFPSLSLRERVSSRSDDG